MHSGAPVVYGTAASRHLRVPGTGRRCLSALICLSFYSGLFRPSTNKLLSASCNNINILNTEINIDIQNLNFGYTQINIDIHFNFGFQLIKNN